MVEFVTVGPETKNRVSNPPLENARLVFHLLFFFYLYLGERALLYSPCWSRNEYAVQADLKLSILWLQPLSARSTGVYHYVPFEDS